LLNLHFSVLRAEAAPELRAHTIWTINADTDLNDFATGSDADIGGLSTCTLDKDEEGNGRFWGEMRTSVQKAYEGKVRGGYAGFRNKVRP
jgi:NADH dehydrogenase [ubiquinone] 1 alpha subcomplex assembly factor 1